jgi:hypothetical protein
MNDSTASLVSPTIKSQLVRLSSRLHATRHRISHTQLYSPPPRVRTQWSDALPPLPEKRHDAIVVVPAGGVAGHAYDDDDVILGGDADRLAKSRFVSVHRGRGQVLVREAVSTPACGEAASSESRSVAQTVLRW